MCPSIHLFENLILRLVIFRHTQKQLTTQLTMPTYQQKQTKYAWSQFYTKCDECSGLLDVFDKLNLTDKQKLRMYIELWEQGYMVADLWALKVINRHRLKTLFKSWFMYVVSL
mgnify:CR=1 FL=1